MKKSFLVVILLIISCLLSIACGQSKQVSKDRDDSLQQIKKRGKVIVATEAALEPMEFVEDGKIVGYGADILAEIVKSLDVPVEQLDVPFSGILTGLESKKFDFVATSVTVTPERKEKFGLTIPLVDGSLVLVVLKNNDTIKSVEDLNGKSMSCVVGSSLEEKHKKLDEDFKAKGQEGFKELKFYQSNPESYLDLKNGNVDAVVIDDYQAKVLMKKEPDTYKIVSLYGVDRTYLSWAVRKEDKELLEFLNAEILKMKQSGKLAELQQKWFGTTFDLPEQLP